MDDATQHGVVGEDPGAQREPSDQTNAKSDGEQRSREDEHGLHELALRLVTGRPAGGSWETPGAEPQLYVGELPPSFPVSLSQPEGSRVVGGVQVGSVTTIYLDAPQSPQQVLDFYRERLPLQGWKPISWPPRPRPGGGFVASMGPMPTRMTFCAGEEAPALTVSAAELHGATAGKRTAVQVDLDTFAEHPEQSPCLRPLPTRGPMGGMRPHPPEVLPAIVGPAGAQQQPQGGSGGPDYRNTSALLRTDLPLAEVRDSYERQLLDAGWMRTASGESGPMAWSTWGFKDDEGQPWRATLFILHDPEAQDAYELLLRARSQGRRNSLGGGFSYAPMSAGQTVVSSISTSGWNVATDSPGTTEMEEQQQAARQEGQRGEREGEQH